MGELTKAQKPAPAIDVSLDPEDWPGTRAQAHRMLDDILDYVETIRERPVWQPIPDAVRHHFRAPLPHTGEALADVHAEFMNFILPYATGNVHPGFMGWVHGAGTVPGLLAEMLAAGLNSNLGGRDHVPVEVERQIVQWVRELFHFPEEASGLFVTGSSMANLMAVLVARTAAMGTGVRDTGLGKAGAHLRGYASRAAHGCVRKAFDLSGLGASALREIAVDSQQRIVISQLRAQIAHDREMGLKPFVIIGSAGTVDAGAIDDLEELAALCAEHKIWLHIDGAYGALGMLSPQIAPRLKGMEKADSIAFDFHKWGQVPYDAGFLIVRDGKQHFDTFAMPSAYLRRETRGLAAGSPWPCDFGPDLSRGFRALKTWFTIKSFGTARLGAMIEGLCALARHLEGRVRAEPKLELLAAAQLNIVCFRYRTQDADADAVNAAIVADLHESGIAAPSTTTIEGKLAIRCAIVNHRAREGDLDAMVDAVLRFGGQRGDGR